MPREAGAGFYIHFKDTNTTARAWCGGGRSDAGNQVLAQIGFPVWEVSYHRSNDFKPTSLIIKLFMRSPLLFYLESDIKRPWEGKIVATTFGIKGHEVESHREIKNNQCISFQLCWYSCFWFNIIISMLIYHL